MTHLMLDSETLSTRPGGVVMSVALVRFSDEAHCSINLNISEQQALGLTIDPKTEAWWAQQDRAAWAAATSNPLPVGAALDYLSSWINWASGGADPLIWAHGASFDGPMLTALYDATGREPPWKFWNLRDTRTLYDLAGVDVRNYACPPPHVALNDALAQTRAAVAALGVLAKAHA